MTPPERESLAWDELMRLGLGTLRLSSDVFWSMTPVELQRALEGSGVLAHGSGPGWMGRPALDALMMRYPDKEGTE